jgi:rod shape determining protein RodA
MNKLNRLKQLNLWVIAVIFLLAGIGILMLYSAANGSIHPWGTKQLSRFGIGIFLMLIVALTDIRLWLNKAYTLYFISLVLLVAVEIMGFVGMGAQRWINLYAFNLQPSELMRVALVLALARYFNSCTLTEVSRLQYLIIPIILIIVPTLLAMRQPDLGTAVILIFSGSAIFFVAGVRWWKFVITGISGLAAIPIFWTFLHEYQKKRIIIFLNPESDPSNSGYHIMQSKIALGSGGLFGKGFLQGTQSHLNFLPEKQTDFIFTMFCEEFGLVAAVLLMLLYSVIILYGYDVALNCRNHFGRLLAIGLTSTLFLYVFINMGMVMGILPVVGIPLPLISYGGTAMLTLLIGQGLIFSIALHNDIRVGK